MMEDMPDFKPLTLDERIEGAAPAESPLHHSITDWDFSTVNWALDETNYVTLPSLHATSTCYSLVKDATTGALSDGRLVLWVRSSGSSYLPWLLFRNQKADGGSDIANGYLMGLYAASLEFSVYVNNVNTGLGSKAHTWSWSSNTWYKMRITWWTSVDRLYVRVERWNGDAWVTLGDEADTDFQDPNERFKDAAVNRCGVYLYSSQDWMDDVEVWG